MRVMTFNLRFENDRDGENAWQFRRELVVDVVGRFTPDILGTQEGTPSQLRYLQGMLPGYRMYAPNRFWDEICQYPTIFYRVDALQVRDGGEFWLSTTPAVHKSKDWDSAFPRMMSYGMFQDLSTNRPFIAVVTHLDHIGTEARAQQGEIIAQWLRKLKESHILMGDFNDVPGSFVHELLLDPQTGLRDTWQALGKGEDADSMTHHDFRGIPQKFRMDWILVSRDFHVLKAVIVRDHRGNRYPSDHFPYAVDLDWV